LKIVPSTSMWLPFLSWFVLMMVDQSFVTLVVSEATAYPRRLTRPFVGLFDDCAGSRKVALTCAACSYILTQTWGAISTTT
jgi:hypothetical protein